MSDIVNKLWGFCHTLRHDGIDYGDYIEQLTYLLFLKMSDERSVQVPKGYDWTSLKALSASPTRRTGCLSSREHWFSGASMVLLC
jgi:type I restriction enzyme M protein